MKSLRLIGWLGVAVLLAHGMVQAANTTVELVVADQQVPAGGRTWVGIRMEMAEHWHTYWVNPGDSGGATGVDWQLPEGFTVGNIEWPVPEKLDVMGIVTYVYEDEVLLLAPLEISVSVAPGEYELQAGVSWLECAELCLPGEGDVSGKIRVGSETVPSDASALFETWRMRVPKPRTDIPGLSARWEGEVSPDDEERTLTIEWQAEMDPARADFFPYASDDFELGAATERQLAAGGPVTLRKRAHRWEGAWPVEIPGVLVARPEPEPTAYQVVLKVETETAAMSVEAGLPVGKGDVEANTASPAPSLFLMLWFAFVGGLILNVMPCVLPVIALKVMGFLNQAKESAATVRRHGLIYGAGVLVSFLALATVVLMVQAGGRAASWGMQFQNPLFLVAMTTLVALVALNLFGLFEVTLNAGAMGSAAQLASKQGAAGAFFNGVLATALATPCTAPFLGLALGFAFAQPPFIVVLMFLCVGLGLAVPYVLISFVPGLARFLPKPGAWMEKFKIAMGFPMAATAFWLLSLLSRHYGSGAVLWMGVFLTLIACAAWVWGTFVQRGQRRKWLGRAFALLLLATAYFGVLEGQLHWREPATMVAGREPIHSNAGIPWVAWTPEGVATARQDGRPVLVDFTADWCVTCQANKKTSLEIPEVEAKLAAMGAAVFLGDYTLKNEAITKELQRWGRAGVPLVLVYPKNGELPPRVLPELLTPGTVLEALDWAAGD